MAQVLAGCPWPSMLAAARAVAPRGSDGLGKLGVQFGYRTVHRCIALGLAHLDPEHPCAKRGVGRGKGALVLGPPPNRARRRRTARKAPHSRRAEPGYQNPPQTSPGPSSSLEHARGLPGQAEPRPISGQGEPLVHLLAPGWAILPLCLNAREGEQRTSEVKDATCPKCRRIHRGYGKAQWEGLTGETELS